MGVIRLLGNDSYSAVMVYIDSLSCVVPLDIRCEYANVYTVDRMVV